MQSILKSINIALALVQVVNSESWRFPNDRDGRIYPDTPEQIPDLYSQGSEKFARYTDNIGAPANSLRDCICLHPRYCPRYSTILPGACGIGKAYCCESRKHHQALQLFLPGNRRPNFNHHGYHENNIFGQRQVLTGPGGPTGFIGPNNRPGFSQNFNQQQGGVLVGPGGPTGVIGPARQNVLVGPGGPTGIIGPRNGRSDNNKQNVLVGPGGPTGIIGPDVFE